MISSSKPCLPQRNTHPVNLLVWPQVSQGISEDPQLVLPFCRPVSQGVSHLGSVRATLPSWSAALLLGVGVFFSQLGLWFYTSVALHLRCSVLQGSQELALAWAHPVLRSSMGWVQGPQCMARVGQNWALNGTQPRLPGLLNVKKKLQKYNITRVEYLLYLSCLWYFKPPPKFPCLITRDYFSFTLWFGYELTVALLQYFPFSGVIGIRDVPHLFCCSVG